MEKIEDPEDHRLLLCERHSHIWLRDRALIKRPASGCLACTVIEEASDLRAKLAAAEERIGLLRDQIEGEEIDHDKAILKLQAKLAASRESERETAGRRNTELNARKEAEDNLAVLDAECPACHHLMRFHDPDQDDTHACIQCAHKASQMRAAASEESKRLMREALVFYAEGAPCCETNVPCGAVPCEYPNCAKKQFPSWDQGDIARAALKERDAEAQP